MKQLDYIPNSFAQQYITSISGVIVPMDFMALCDDNPFDAILLAQIIYWYRPNKEGKRKLQVYNEGHWWVAKKHSDWYGECRINERTIRRCLKRLQDSGLIVYKVSGFKGMTIPHVRINWDVFEAKIKTIQKEAIDPKGQSSPEVNHEASEIDERLTPEVSPIDPKGQGQLTPEVNPNTEITTEITTENLKDISKDISAPAVQQAADAEIATDIDWDCGLSDKELEHIFDPLPGEDNETIPFQVSATESVESETKPKIQIVPMKAGKPESKKTRKQSVKKTQPNTPKSETPDAAQEAVDHLQTQTALVKAIAFTFATKDEFGGMNAQLRMQLLGKHKKGKRAEYNFDEPATPVEVVGFKFYRQSKYAEAKIPTAAETLYERFLEFRGDERYARALELGEEKLRELLKLEAKPEAEDDEEYAPPEAVAAAFARLAASLEKLQEKNKLAQMTTDEYYAHLYEQKQQRLRREAEQQACLGQ